jgi:hypothetical protein
MLPARLLYSCVVWCLMVWCGVLWCGVVSYGVVWCDTLPGAAVAAFCCNAAPKERCPLVRIVELTKHESSHESPSTLSDVPKGQHSLHT